VKAGPIGLTEGSKNNRLLGECHRTRRAEFTASSFLMALSASNFWKLEKTAAEYVLQRAKKYK